MRSIASLQIWCNEKREKRIARDKNCRLSFHRTMCLIREISAERRQLFRVFERFDTKTKVQNTTRDVYNIGTI